MYRVFRLCCLFLIQQLPWVMVLGMYNSLHVEQSFVSRLWDLQVAWPERSICKYITICVCNVPIVVLHSLKHQEYIFPQCLIMWCLPNLTKIVQRIKQIKLAKGNALRVLAWASHTKRPVYGVARWFGNSEQGNPYFVAQNHKYVLFDDELCSQYRHISISIGWWDKYFLCSLYGFSR